MHTNDANVNTSDEWTGDERRKHGGRVVYSRGPIIRTLELFSAIAGLCAIVALVLALTLFGDRLSLIQQSRERSASDTCFLFRAVVLKAGEESGKLPQSEAFLTQVGLSNCIAFGHNVTQLRSGN